MWGSPSQVCVTHKFELAAGCGTSAADGDAGVLPVGSVLAYAARAKEAGDEVETLIFDGDDLAADVPGHFSIITPSLGDEGGWPLQVRMMEDMMSRLAASADGAARL